jgi:hypothetical protein
MNTKLIIGTVIVLIIIVGGAVTLQKKTANAPADTENGDGTGTTELPATGEEIIITRIDGGASAFGVTILPLEVTEDSRCPSDVTCIWAGTVRVRARVTYDTGESEHTFTLDEAIATDGVEMTLTDVKPETVSTRQIMPGEYSFTFVIKKN